MARGDASDPDFLKTYPDETDVSDQIGIHLIRHVSLPFRRFRKDLHLQHLKVTSELLPQLHFSRFGKTLKRLCLRQNNLTSPLPAEAFQGLEALTELDMYDNRLGSRVRDNEIAGCSSLT